jgi:hypothetical protein
VALRAKLLLVHASPETLWTRGIELRRKQHFITGYARKLGPSLEEIHRHFLAEQAAMRAAVSRLNRLELCVDGELAGYLDDAYRFWLS